MQAVQKRKPTRGDMLVALVIITVALLGVVLLPGRDGKNLTACVTVNGELVWSCPLDSLSEPISYTAEGEYPLTLEVSKDGVRVVESSCSGEDCRHTGLITKMGLQIVCLPNRTVVTLKGNDPHYDAVTG